jgi:formylglycine-generating enzyme required for sulfatase activity
VTWHEAIAFCNWLSELEGLQPAYRVEGETVSWPDRDANGYRLPTEAEWEYAARAGTRTIWVGTDEAKDACRYGNVADGSLKAKEPDWQWDIFPCNDGSPRLAPVTAREVNPWHLHGLGGNAAEWVWDWYGDYPQGEGAVEDPVGPDGGSDRVVRGGAWWDGPRIARVAFRIRNAPGLRDGGVGFRLARSCPSALLPSDCLPPS